MEFLLVLVALVVAFFVFKDKLLKPDVPKSLDFLRVRGAPLVKKTQPTEASEATVTPVPVSTVATDSVPLSANEPEQATTEITQSAEPASSVAIAESPADTTPTRTNEVQIPQDSVLRRHYLAQIAATREAITHPYPTDSVLRRHYESLHGIAVPAPASTTAIRHPIESSQILHAANAQLPEDSVLKRHALALIKAQIESELSARPTDSVLKRHYDSLVATKLHQHLTNVQH